MIINREKFVLGQDTVLIQAFEANPAFVYYRLQTTPTQSLIHGLSGGSTFSRINLKDIRGLKIAVSSSDSEQQKISSFLTAVDKRIKLLEEKKEQLERYKQGVMQKIFSQEIRFKDEEGKDFPDWEEKRLGDLGDTFNGLTGKTKENFGEGKPYIQYMQIFNSSRIETEDFGLVEIDEGENQSKAQFGDIFFTTSSETPNEIGTSSVLLSNVDEVYLNSFCFGYRPNSLDELVPEFAQFLFRSSNVRRQIIRLAQGSTRFNMSKVALMKQVVELPSKAEQLKIAAFLTSLDDSIQGYIKQIEETSSFKMGLLQKMFV